MAPHRFTKGKNMKKSLLPLLALLLLVGINGDVFAQSIDVSGAGSGVADGTYSYRGQWNSKNSYQTVNCYLYWEPGYPTPCWKIADHSGNGYYMNTNNTTLPPAGDWRVDNVFGGGGSLPVPTLTGDVDPLPVELTSFRASVNSNLVNLQWFTATELDNCGFEVQRRIIGETAVSWNAIGFVAGAGTNTSPHNYSYTDKNLSAGRYAYRIKQIDRDGSFKYVGNAEVEVGAPAEYALGANFPNPFNPTTTIRYALPTQSRVRVSVYNTLGQIVAELVNAEQAAGWNEVVWNAKVASGLYFYRLEAISLRDPGKRFVDVKKMILLK
jgi:hypothetical protein